MTISRPTLGDTALIILTGLIWGSAFMSIKIAVAEMPPSVVAFVRVLLGFLAVGAFTLMKRHTLPRGRANWRLTVLVGFFNMALPFYLISWAETRVSSGVAALLMGTSPLIAAVAGHFTSDDDKLSAAKLLGAFLGFAGILLVFGRTALESSGQDFAALLALLAAVVSYVASGVMVRRIDHNSSEGLSTAIMAMGALLLLPVAIFEGLPHPGDISSRAMWALLWLGIVPTGVAFLLRFHLTRKVGISAFSQGIYFVPVTGLILGTLILGETIPLNVWLALALIIAGIFIARRGWKDAPRGAEYRQPGGR